MAEQGGCYIGDKPASWYCENPGQAAEELSASLMGKERQVRLEVLSGITAVLLYDQGNKRTANFLEHLFELLPEDEVEQMCDNIEGMITRCSKCGHPVLVCQCQNDA